MKITSAFLALVVSSCAFAQMKFPAVSSHAEIEQKVGLTDFEIVYNRPNVSNREIFGKLVPDGEVWRTGANENTTISFDQPIKVNGKELAAGKYGLFTIPNKNSWDIIFYKESNNWGNQVDWKESNVALKVSVVPTKLKIEKLETFEIRFTNVKQNNADLVLAWDDISVKVNLETNTKEAVLKMIKENLNSNSSARDFYNSANFYYTNRLDRKQALEWINTAIKKDAKVPGYFKELKETIEKDNY